MANPPEREVGKGSSREGWNHIQGEICDSERKISSSKTGKAILSESMKRMELERKKVIRYLDNQKESRKKLNGWMVEDGQLRSRETEQEEETPTGWTSKADL